MTEYHRKYYHQIMDRLKEKRMFIQVLAGPRQVGKTTLIKQIEESISIPFFFFSADTIDGSDSNWIKRTWESVRSRMSLLQMPEVILAIDEIQKIERWSEFVKREWDADTADGLNIKVILLGSSRLLIRKGLTESLAGRYELIRMGHWGYTEMRDAFGIDLPQWIYYGGYPGTAGLWHDFKRWRKYVKDSLITPAIEKDVLMTTFIYKPALLKQLFELGCSYSGEMLSLTKVLGQMQDAGNVTTLSSYINILKEANLLCGLQKYANDESRKRQSPPKFSVYNNALLTAYRGKGFDHDYVDPMLWGRWVESAVGTYLLDFAEDNDCQLYYWRERDTEVDYILVSQGEALALEVKSGKRGMNSGLPIFEKKYHPKRAIVIGTDGIPFEEFFTADLTALL